MVYFKTFVKKGMLKNYQTFHKSLFPLQTSAFRSVDGFFPPVQQQGPFLRKNVPWLKPPWKPPFLMVNWLNYGETTMKPMFKSP